MRIFLTLLALVSTGPALAHPSLVPHTHPHGPSALPDLELFVVAVVIIGVAVLAAGTLFKRR
jgi:hypothetical protein